MTKDTPLEAKLHLINRNDTHDDGSIEKIINLESVFKKKVLPVLDSKHQGVGSFMPRIV